MLESIHVESYRTLRNTSVTFRDGLNIIIGQNGVGKSNLLEFVSTYTWGNIVRIFPVDRLRAISSDYSYQLSFLNEQAQRTSLKIEFEKIRATTTKDRELDLKVELSRKVGDNLIDEKLEVPIADKKRLILIDRDIREAKPFLGTYIRFNLPDHLEYLSASSSMTINSSNGLFSLWANRIRFLNEFESFLEETFDDEHNRELLSDAIQTKAILNREFERAVEGICLNDFLASFTNIQKVRLGKNANIYQTDTGSLIENLVVEFLIDGSWMPWSYLSDGTKRSFYLIAEVAFAKDELILIEEPEIGLHPFQLQKVMTFLKEQSATKQIILSTHSPQVLNALEPDELDQILIASIKKGVTSFRRLTDAQKEKARIYMTEVGELSDYWLHSDLEQEPEAEEAI